MPDSMCSSGTLGEKAGRLVIRVKRKIKKKDIGEENLKSLRAEINLMLKLLRRDDERVHSAIIRKLIRLKDQINDKLDRLAERHCKQHQQPKGKMPEWDGTCESYLLFRAGVKDLLVYYSDF